MNEASGEVSRCGGALRGLAFSRTPRTGGQVLSASGRQRCGAPRGWGDGEWARAAPPSLCWNLGSSVGGELAAGRVFQASYWWMCKGDSHSFRRCGLARGDVRKVCSWCEIDCGLLETPELVNMWVTVWERKFMRCLGTVSLSSPVCGCFLGIAVEGWCP